MAVGRRSLRVSGAQSHGEEELRKDILGRPLLTVQQLEAMTEEERDEVFRASIIYDLDLLPPSYVAKCRAHLEQTIARREAVEDEGE